MSGLDFLDLVIGLIFIYLVYSIAASTLWEIFVNITHLRAKMLNDWITRTFISVNSSDDMNNAILEHPVIKALSRDGKSSPTYVSSAVFTDVLIDILTSKEISKYPNGSSVTFDMVSKGLKDASLSKPGINELLSHFLNIASGNMQILKEKIGNWYDEAQEALKGSYKRNPNSETIFCRSSKATRT